MANFSDYASKICRVPLRGQYLSSSLPQLFAMPQAIIRVAKIKTAGAARGKTAHNYRLMDTPNADPARTATLNQEYVNTDRADYWSLAEQRIAEVVTRKVRDDQVRAMEFVLTASPDWFKRGQDGQAEDMRESKWVADNLHFIKEKFGEKNVVSFTLHQDEKTPHVHAVVIPITDKNRLSADTLFNPKTLVKLQTEYAAAMAEHGLERGIEGSRRQHQDMKQVYGHQQATAAELAPLVQPVVVQAFRLPDVPFMGRDEWRAEQEAAINAEIARQVGEANQRLEKAANVAGAHAGSSEQAETLARQLAISQGLKQGHYADLEASTGQVKTLTERSEQLAVQLAQGGGPEVEALTAYGQHQREKARQELVGILEGVLLNPVSGPDAFRAELESVGYMTGKDAQGKGVLIDEQTGASFHLSELKPNELDLRPQLATAIERTTVAAYLESEAGKRDIEQAERQVRGQQPHEGRAVLEMDAKDLETIKKHFLDVRAGVRPDAVQADGRVQLEIVYQHTQPTIRSINTLLNQAQKWTGVTVQEDRHDREHRQAGAERRGQELKAEKGQSKGRDRGPSIGG
jgi:hypothetical protein